MNAGNARWSLWSGKYVIFYIPLCLPSPSSITMTPPSKRSQVFKFFKLGCTATCTFDITASKRRGSLPLVPWFPTIVSTESQLDPFYDGIQSPSSTQYGPASAPVEGSTARPPKLIGQFKNWGGNLRHSLNKSPRENDRRSLALNGSGYTSLIILHPEDRTYPLYNLDAKLGERDGYTSIEFLCSASSDSVSSFREITLEVELFHLGNVNSKNYEHCYSTQRFRQGSNSDECLSILSRRAPVDREFDLWLGGSWGQC